MEHTMEFGRLVAVAVIACAGAAFADVEIDLDMAAKPLKDLSKTGCNQGMGFNAALENIWGAANDDWWFVSNRVESARILKAAGANLLRLQCMNWWFDRRTDKKNPTNPKAAFDFYKANGIKVFVCLECNKEEMISKNVEIVKWIVDNGYKDCVAGFEMGNETYGSPKYPEYAPRWKAFIDQAEKVWPKIPLGMNIGELFELNPDIKHMRARLMGNEEIKRDWSHAGAYFSADSFNRFSMLFVQAMSNYLGKIDHIIYHAYGAETPYSCSYHGFKRFRNFTEIMPELKGKKYWLTEIRQRSDEDNHCQRIYRETLITAHYSLMALCQPETDGFCQHQLTALSGALFQSDGRSWYIQWYDGTQECLPDRMAPYGQPRMEVGQMGAMYRILTQGIAECPLFLQHGTERGAGTDEWGYCCSARLTDEVYARRRAIKEGKSDVPAVRGELEWVASTRKGGNKLCLLMVNSKNEPQTVRVTAKGKQFAAPTYRTLSCPEEFVDCCEIPGEGRAWRQLSWEDSNQGYWGADMAAYKGLKPVADAMTVTIKPHTVQTVTVMLRDAPKAK